MYEELNMLYSSDQIKENEVIGTCGTHGRGEKSVQGFDGKAWRKETIFKAGWLKIRRFAYILTYYVSRVDQAVQCLTRGWTTGRSRFDPRQKRKDFSSRLCVQTGSGAHPASCTMGTEGPFPGTKTRPGRDADHSPPPSAEVENDYDLYLLSPSRLKGV
jgi:hypothetical protein